MEFLNRWFSVMACLLFLAVVLCLVFVIPAWIINSAAVGYKWLGFVWFFVAISAVVAAVTD